MAAAAVPDTHVGGEAGDDGFIDLGVIQVGGAAAVEPLVPHAADRAPPAPEADVTTSATADTAASVTAVPLNGASLTSPRAKGDETAFPDVAAIVEAEVSTVGPRAEAAAEEVAQRHYLPDGTRNPAYSPRSAGGKGAGSPESADGVGADDAADADGAHVAQLLAAVRGQQGGGPQPNAAVVAALSAAAAAVPFDDIDDAPRPPDDDGDLFAALEALGGLGAIGTTAEEIRAGAAALAGSPSSPHRQTHSDPTDILGDVSSDDEDRAAGPTSAGAAEADVTAEHLMADLIGTSVTDVRAASAAASAMLGDFLGTEGVRAPPLPAPTGGADPAVSTSRIEAALAAANAAATQEEIAEARRKHGVAPTNREQRRASVGSSTSSSSSSEGEDLTGVPVLDAETAAASRARQKKAAVSSSAAPPDSEPAHEGTGTAADVESSSRGGGLATSEKYAVGGDAADGGDGKSFDVQEHEIRLTQSPFGIALRAVTRSGHGATVEALLPDGAAAAEGSIQVGDLIVAIGAVKTATIHFDEIVALLREAGSVASRVVPATITVARKAAKDTERGAGAAATGESAAAGAPFAPSATSRAGPGQVPTAAEEADDDDTDGVISGLDFAFSGLRTGSAGGRTGGAHPGPANSDTAAGARAFSAGLWDMLAKQEPRKDAARAAPAVASPGGSDERKSHGEDASASKPKAAAEVMPTGTVDSPVPTPPAVTLSDEAAAELAAQFAAESKRTSALRAEDFIKSGGGTPNPSGAASGGDAGRADSDAAAGEVDSATGDDLVGDAAEGIDPRENRRTDVPDAAAAVEALPFSSSVSAMLAAGLEEHLASYGGGSDD